MKIRVTTRGFLTVIFLFALCIITLTTFTYSSGPPASYTGAPSESNCTSCHTGSAISSGFAWNNISLTGNFTGGGYIPDSTYTMTLEIDNSSRSRFGFQLTCLDDDDDMAGSFTNTSSATSKQSGSGSLNDREYIQHTSSGTSGTGGRSWSFNWTAPSSNLDSVTYYVVINAANGSGTGGDSILLKQFKIGPSSLLPTASISATPNPACSKDSVQFTGSSNDSNATYSWTFPAGSPSTSTQQNPKVYFAFGATPSIKLTTSNSKGSSKEASYTLTVKATPNASIIGSLNREICEGDSTQIVVSFDPQASYLWSHGATGNSIFVKDSGSYSVVVSKGGCSAESSTVNVSYKARPSIGLSQAAGGSDSACGSASIMLEATAGLDSYYYFNGSSLWAKTASSQYTTPTITSSSSLGVIAKDIGGCWSDTARYEFTIIPRLDSPNLSCTVLSKTSLQFDFSGAQFHQGYEISLDSGNNWSSPSSGSTGTTHLMSGLSPQQSVALWVRGLDDAPCLYSQNARLICQTDSCVALNVFVNAPSEACYGKSARVVVNGLANANFGLNFENNGWFTDTAFNFIPTLSKNYVLLLQDSNQLECPAQEILIPITVDRFGDVNLQADKSAYCQGDEAVFSVNDSADHVIFIYNGANAQDGASTSYTRAEVGLNDSVRAVASLGSCTDTSEYIYPTVNPSPNANFSFQRVGPNYDFSPEDENQASYSWDFGDGNQSTETSPTHDFGASQGQERTVTLTVVDANGCTSDSSIIIQVPDLSNIAALEQQGLKIYPNPVLNQLVIESDYSEAVIQIMNQKQQLVKSFELRIGMNEFSLEDLASGYYLLKFKFESSEQSTLIYKH